MAGDNAAQARVDAASEGTPASAAALRQVVHIVRPLVQLLLAHGVTYPQLADMLKLVFIDVARRDADPDARRMTDSRLAVKTGIHRKDVKRLCAAEAQIEADGARKMSVSLTSAVFTRWLSDAAYCDADGKPRTLLRRADSDHSFEKLVKSISTDVHPRTVLNELSRLGLIDIEGDSIHPKLGAFVPRSDFMQMLEYLGANLHDHAATAVRNTLGGKPAFLEQSIFSEAVHAEAVEELAGLARQEWAHMLKTIVPEVARHEPSEQEGGERVGTPRAQRARIRVGMYFYAEDESPIAQTEHAKLSNRNGK